jgi:hypothetical protein
VDGQDGVPLVVGTGQHLAELKLTEEPLDTLEFVLGCLGGLAPLLLGEF